MTAITTEAPTPMPPPDGRCIPTTPTALIPVVAAVPWQQLRTMTDSRPDTTPLVEAGIGVAKLVERAATPELKIARLLGREFVIPPVDERATKDAEDEVLA